jgi:opacity protein-like surface antigen
VAIGAAGGYWFDNFPYLGIEGSIQWWQPDIDEQDNVRTDVSSTTRSFKAEVDALSFGLIGLVRYPFGPFVPYGGGGMTVTHLAFNDVQINQQDVRADDDLFPTVTVKAGLTWYVTPNLGVFVEYKYINKHFDTTFGRDGSNLEALDTVEVDMDAQFVEGGIEWRFWDPFAQ